MQSRFIILTLCVCVCVCVCVYVCVCMFVHPHTSAFGNCCRVSLHIIQAFAVSTRRGGTNANVVGQPGSIPTIIDKINMYVYSLTHSLTSLTLTHHSHMYVDSICSVLVCTHKRTHAHTHTHTHTHCHTHTHSY